MNESTDAQEKRESGDSQQAQWGIVIGAFIIGGILGAASNPTDPVGGFFGIGLIFGVVAWAFATDSGRYFLKKAFLEESIKNVAQQQQQGGTRSKPKVVCSNCGWQNPKGNNFCHDCGEKLST